MARRAPFAIRLPVSAAVVVAIVAAAPSAAQCTIDESDDFGGSGGGTGEGFGGAVAVDGDVAVVGTSAGRGVHFFRRDGDAWVQDVRVAGVPGTGQAVALDGLTAFVGAPRSSGLVYVYERLAGTWTRTRTLSGAGGNEAFGRSVAMSGDDGVIGAPRSDERGEDAGRAYACRRLPDSGLWVIVGSLFPPAGTAGDQFGHAVAIDGDRIIVGAPYADDGFGDDGGAAYVFERDGDQFALTETLRPPDRAAGDNFGFAVAVRGDRLLVGAPGADDAYLGPDAGSARMYAPDGDAWIVERKFVAYDGIWNQQYGWAIAFGDDRILIGTRPERSARLGEAYLYAREHNGWRRLATLVGSNIVDPIERFGTAVAIGGGTALVGASRKLQDDRLGRAEYTYPLLDCNDNGRLDQCDIADGTSDDIDGDGVPDECGCPGDVDGDDVVGFEDLIAVLAAWGDEGGPADVDGDGIVDFNDVIALLARWGPC